MAQSAAEDDEPITGINVTPLVDIVLVLLIIFMMTASYIVRPAIDVNLPKAATGEAKPNTSLVLVISKEGRTFLNNQEVTERQIRGFIQDELRQGRDPEAVLAADASVPHGKMVALIDLIREEGLTKFAINTDADFKASDLPPPTPEGTAPATGGEAPAP